MIENRNQQEATPSSPILSFRQPVDFLEAMRLLMKGKRITRVEWHDHDAYGLLFRGLLMIHKSGEPDGQFHAWMVSDGDLFATDWVVSA